MTGLDWAAVALAACIALTSPIVLRRVLFRSGIMDVPNARSSHAHPVMRGGGLASLTGLVAAVPFLLLAQNRSLVIAAVAVGAGAAVLGFVDDLRSLPAGLRLGLHVILGGVGAWLVFSVTDSWWGWIAVLVVAGYVNVVNFMDGIDLITGLHGTVVGGALAVVGAVADAPFLAVGGALVAVVFLTFLPWNVLGARMFLGDAGSYLLGAVLSMLAVGAIASGLRTLAVFAPFAIYITDTSITLIRRLRQGENIFLGHRSHMYQRLLGAGWSHTRVALTVTAFSIAAAAVGLLTLGALAGWVGLVGVVVVCICYMAFGEFVSRGGAARGAPGA